MPRQVLDSSAVLALIFEEPGADLVAKLIDESLICAVNITEIVTRLYDRGWRIEAAAAEAAKLCRRIAPFDDILAYRAGHLRADTRDFGLSLGDRACLALAEAALLPVYTADKEWAQLDLGIDIRLVR
jgi:ribonuclease VapC